MSNMMAVLYNGVAQLEYDREKQLTDYQKTYLDKMDRKMESGIEVGNELIKNPDVQECAKFVAGNLFHAIMSGDEGMCSALCCWLATRLPDIKQVAIHDENGEVLIDLVYDESYKKQVSVSFTSLH